MALFCLYSEEDLERALGAYAKQSHSSTTVFLNSTSKPESNSTTSTSSTPPTSDLMRTRTGLKASQSDQVLRKRESNTAAESAVKRQESTISVQSIENSSEQNTPSSSAAPSRYAWLKEHAVEDDSLTSALPKYSRDMLESSDLPLNSKTSLEKLTQSLQSVGKVPSSISQSGGRMRTASATARLTPHKRSLSVQSLASTASSVDSGILNLLLTISILIKALLELAKFNLN